MTPPTAPSVWKLRSQTLTLGPLPLVMGIVNVTPDSFSDGGKFSDTHSAIKHALRLANQGAAILDVGGESTRPYSAPVDTRRELDRVIPVIEGITKETKTPVSIDTSKASVAAAAIEAGAQIINDVTGLEGDPRMPEVALNSGAGICAMHMKGDPQTMQDDPQYTDVVKEIYRYLDQRKTFLLNAGIELEKICLDPGIGFGKTHEHNLQLITNCEAFLELGCPILIGHSRKGFIGKTVDVEFKDNPDTTESSDQKTLANDFKIANRDAGTLAITLMLARKGMQIVRVHEVAQTVAALKMQSKV